MFSIEKATSKDIPALSNFLYRERRDLAENLGVDLTEANNWVNDSCSEKAINEQLSFEPSIALIVKSSDYDKKILASALLNTPSDDVPEFYGLYVHNNYRLRGLGKALTLARLAFLASIGENSARMWTFNNNHKIISLALGLGFSPTTRKYEKSHDGWEFTEMRNTDIKRTFEDFDAK